MSPCRRLLLKRCAVVVLGGLLLACILHEAGVAGRKKRSGRRASNSSKDEGNAGANSVVRFPGTNITYKPFTQTFQRPKILGFDSIHVEDAIDYDKHGIVKPTNADPEGDYPLTPYPGSPEPSARSFLIRSVVANLALFLLWKS